jgi:hypothetical protein
VFVRTKSIEIPFLVKAIFSSCHLRNHSIEEIQIRISIESIDGFLTYQSLQSIVFDPIRCVKEIDALDGCDSLRAVKLPDSVIWIHQSGFSRCGKSSKIVFAADSQI